ncbi:MAG TPA: DUF2142 domain-containing protein, partial [Aquihabitans sp.]|nr:DUF2142 domain-containing protein [Aquihabitans sp.]
MQQDPTTATPAVRGDGRRGWRRWGGWFAPLAVIGALWAFALPAYSGPDEQAHVTKAAAVARGQWQGRHIETVIGTLTEVEVPDVFGDRPADLSKACFAGEPTVPADCATPPTGSTDDVVAGTYVGRYPPAYYGVVGLPTLVAPGTHTLVLMRLVSVVLGAAV